MKKFRDVIVKIQTVQYDLNTDNEFDNIDFTTEGKLFQKKDAYYIVYEESKISGLEGTTTKIKIKDDKVELKRIGINESSMVFEKSTRFKTNLLTPMGEIPLEILTNDVFYEIDKNDILYVFCEYLISIKGLFSGKNIIKIYVKDKNGDSDA